MEIRFGFIKPALDVHTLGINYVHEILRKCGLFASIAPRHIEQIVENLIDKDELLSEWILENQINSIAISYRLDSTNALNIVTHVMDFINKFNHINEHKILKVYYAGLPESCVLVNKYFPNLKTFNGGESIKDTLLSLGVDEDRIPIEFIMGSEYDDKLFKFAANLIQNSDWNSFESLKRNQYKEYGTKSDTVSLRIDTNRCDNFLPLTRAHVGPFSAKQQRREAIDQFINWCKELSDTNYLDIISIGSSQLTQEAFGENWDNRKNGGGVPIQNKKEYEEIYNASRPLLLRTYSGTKNTFELAKLYEETINICWHALSLWWFNKLDGRGPYDLLENLISHFKTMDFIADSNKPFEPNIPHHFSFRGSDDVTYVLSSYLAAILAKKKGIKQFILQIMLNTPRYTWGLQDVAKARASLKLVRELEDESFRVIFQPRAGLDYFSNDLETAKIQLSAVTLMMDDIEPYNYRSPDIIHVVSYSEASHLATPDVINQSVKITQKTLIEYRKYKKDNQSIIHPYTNDVELRTKYLYDSVKSIIKVLDTNIKDLWTPKGFYDIYVSGFLPVPYLWSTDNKYSMAKNWITKFENGGMVLVNPDGTIMDISTRIRIALQHYRKSNRNE